MGKLKPVTIRRPSSPKQTEKTFGVSAKRSRKIDGFVDQALGLASSLKLRALSLDAAGDPSRATWLSAAKIELEAVNTDSDVVFFAGVAEVVACLANACRPLTKDRTRAVVRRFLNPNDLSTGAFRPGARRRR